ncbi:MAG: site-specific integrase [Candidatus Levybacteria bacterium]|nr:site-specific integrase [Candidatus Levybacteria bacterium]
MDLSAQFKSFLSKQKKPASKITIKNYIADLNQFVRWYKSHYNKDFHPSQFTSEVVEIYKTTQSGLSPEYKNATSISARSLKRHLSTLRKFASFLVVKGYISSSPLAINHSPLAKSDPFHLKAFKEHLYLSKSSDLTIKNYINDIKQLCHWAGEIDDISSLINSASLKNYRENLIANSGLSEASIHRKLSSLRRYARFMQEKNFINAKDLSEYLDQTLTSKLLAGARSLEEAKERLSPGQDLNRTQQSTIPAANHDLDTSALTSSAQLPEKPVSSISYQVSSKDTNKSQLNTKYQIPNTRYSRFAPFRLSQKILAPLVLGFDNSVVSLSAKALEKAQYLSWIARGKQIFSSSAKNGLADAIKIKSIVPGNVLPSLLQNNSGSLLNTKYQTSNAKYQILNTKYSPLHPSHPSFSSLPFHLRALGHARHTRPNWYKKYHSYSVVHYFHFAALIIMMSALGFGLYRSFIENPQKEQALAAPPTAPPRLLSFQGRLTDSNDNPITTAKDLRFTVYNDASATGAALLWQETQQLTPDQDGIFSILLGSSTAIPSTVFTDNSTLYLGITVQSDSELTPRQQIATVAFAANAETIQGLLPSTGAGAGQTNVVLALDSSGNLTIGGTANPTFSATGGSFTLSGKTLALNTTAGSNGNVTLTPDGVGIIQLNAPVQNTNTNYRNNIPTAKGAVEIDDMFAVLATSSGQSAFTLNQDSTGPLISASTSGVAKFTIANDGSGYFAGSVGIGDVTPDAPLDVVGDVYISDGLSLYETAVSDGTVEATKFCTGDGETNCVTDFSALVSGSSYWLRNLGALSPANVTDDLLLGANATTSAIVKLPGLTNNNAFFNLGTGNVGIGTTAPVAKLDIRGSGISSPVASISGQTNAVAALVVDNKVGDLFAASSSGLTRFVITQAGNVGIGLGTIMPVQALDVSGNGMFRNSGDLASTFRGIHVLPTTTTSGGSNQVVRGYSTSNGFALEGGNTAFGATPATIVLNGPGGYISFQTNTTNRNAIGASEKMRITSDGNIGIGTTAPLATLHVASISAKALVILDQNNSTQDIFTASAAGVTKFVINNGGNVGILDNSPDAPLDVVGDVYISDGLSLFETAVSDGTVEATQFCTGDGETNCVTDFSALVSGSSYWQLNNKVLSPGNSTHDLAIGGTATSSALFQVFAVGTNAGTASSSGQLTFRGTTDPKINILNGEAFGISTSAGGDAGLTERLTITNDGNVGIGSTLPTQKLFVDGNIGITAGAANSFIGSSTFNGYNPADNGGRAGINAAASFYLNLDSNNDGTTAFFQIAKDSNSLSGGTQLFTVNESGNVGIGTTTNHGFVHINGGTQGGNAALVINQTGAQTNDIFTASSSGATRFSLAGDGSATHSAVTSGGYAYRLTANNLTTGTGMYLSSTSTGLSTGGLLALDWSPGSSTVATGDLLSLNVGANGTLGNIFNVKDNGSSVFSVSQSQITAALPTSFTAAGDTSFAYDINFTNPTASYIKSAAPLYLQAGETFNSSDLTLQTYNAGNVIIDSQAFVTNYAATVSGQLVVGTSTAPANIGNFYLTNSAEFGKSLAILNQTESNDILTGSSSGVFKFVFNQNGNLGIGTSLPAAPLDVVGDIYGSSGISLYNTAVSDDTVEAVRFCTGDGETNCVTDFSALVSGSSYWQRNLGALAPAEITNDLLLGAAATSSAIIKLPGITNKDAFFNLGTGNIGIGTTSPLANLDIRGNLGTAVTASVSANSSFAALLADNRGNGDIFAASSSGLNRFVVRQNGNVGIGTSLPNAALTVLGSAIRLRETDDGNDAITLVSNTTEGAINVNRNGTSVIQLHGGSSSNSYFNAGSGNLGIGTNTPIAKLDVRGSGISSPVASISGQTNAVAALVVDNKVGDLFTASSSGLNRFVITQAGNVGIGTTTPNALLMVGTTMSMGSITANAIVNSTGAKPLFVGQNTGNLGVMIGYDGNDIQGRTGSTFSTNGNLTINRYGGNVAIGTVTPASKLHVGDGTAQTSITIDGLGSASYNGLAIRTANSEQWFIGRNGTDSNDDLIFRADATNNVMSIVNTGAIANTLVLNTGNVGIGSTGPLAALDVVGDAYVSSGISLYNTAVSDDTVEAAKFCTGDGETNCITDFSSITNFWQRSLGALAPAEITNDLLLGAAATSSAIIKLPGITNNDAFFNLGTGNIGIGTTSPLAKLDVRGTGISSPVASISGQTNAVAALVVDNKVGDLFAASSSGLNRFVIRQNGNVGIGSILPTAKLDVNGDVALASGGQIDFADATEDKIYLWGTTYGLGISSGEANWWSGGTFSFRTTSRTGTEIANLSAAGALQIDSVLQVGATAVTTYSRFGTGTTGNGLSGSQDVLFSDDIEVDGNLYLDGADLLGANSAAIDVGEATSGDL